MVIKGRLNATYVRCVPRLLAACGACSRDERRRERIQKRRRGEEKQRRRRGKHTHCQAMEVKVMVYYALLMLFF